MKNLQGTVDIEFNGDVYPVEYTISNVNNGKFDLMITANGTTITESVTQFSQDPVADVIVPHGERMLQMMNK